MAFFVNQCHAQAVLEKYGFRAKIIGLRRHDVLQTLMARLRTNVVSDGFNFAMPNKSEII